jgi:hypothetical protein
MTMCIAAFAGDPGKKGFEISTVALFDSKVETSISGSEIGYKFRKVSDYWGALLAGNISRAEELVSIYSNVLPKTPIPPSEIAETLRLGPAEFKQRLAKEYVNATLGMSLEDFLVRGSTALPKSLFESTANDIARMQLDCQLILIPAVEQLFNYHIRMWVVEGDGTLAQFNDFAAIGSGAAAATTWLHFRSQNRFETRKNTIRNLLEAKKFGENAPGVGKQTHMLVIKPAGKSGGLLADNRTVDRIWRQFGPRPGKELRDDLLNEMFSEETDWKKISIG